jgi:UDP-N-acetyl-D-mannosaminuronic acid dehydrogenase
MSIAELRQHIDESTARLAVIGLGYVGLPVACEFAQAGFNVLGVEIVPGRVEKINAGLSPIEGDEPGLAELLETTIRQGRLRATTGYEDLRDRDVILICVETPVDEDNKPSYTALRSALRSLAPVLKAGALVIVESTVAPRTMSDVVLPLLEKGSGFKVNQGFLLGHCPERVMPGKLLSNLRNVSRVVGGMTRETAQTMMALYKHVVKAELEPTDCLTAELVKTAENAYRDVQIAFANEVALICEALGGDVWKVRELVNKSPYRAMHLPGAGVGGHCIPKDPWLLIANAGDALRPRLIPAARAVNDGMPLHVADMTVRALYEAGVGVQDAKIAVLGYAYLENSDDTRNSPSEVLAKSLQARGAQVAVHDPYVAGYRGDLHGVVQGCHAVIVMVAHDTYRGLDLNELREMVQAPILVDGRNLFQMEQAQAAGWDYRSLGRG